MNAEKTAGFRGIMLFFYRDVSDANSNETHPLRLSFGGGWREMKMADDDGGRKEEKV